MTETAHHEDGPDDRDGTTLSTAFASVEQCQDWTSQILQPQLHLLNINVDGGEVVVPSTQSCGWPC